MRSQPRIVCAAIRNNAGDVIIGIRHFDPGMHEQIKKSSSCWIVNEQGFIDQFSNFYTREEAWKIASESNQIIRRCPGDEGKLFSENIY